MFNGYTEIDIRVSRLMVMLRVYVAIVRKFVNQDLTRIILEIFFFRNRVINTWNSLDRDSVDLPRLNCFKNRLDKIRSTRMGFFMD